MWNGCGSTSESTRGRNITSVRRVTRLPTTGHRRINRRYSSMSTKDETLFDTSEITVSMGPQHPSTHGVLQVKLKLDGERVLDAECVIGYLHRGVEKLGEVQTYGQWVPTLDRMDYVAAVSNCLGYCETIEKFLGITA